AHHDGLDKLLPPPAVFHEGGREPVEQFRMRGALAAHAEITDGAHESFAEQSRPDVIDGNARCERILFAHEPAREVEARGIRLGQLRQHVERIRLDLAFRAEEITTMEQLRYAWVGRALSDDT